MQPKFIPHVPPRVYSKACIYGSLIFLAGEDCKDPTTKAIRGSTVREQTEYLFQNMQATLEELGSSLDNVVSMTAFLTDPRGKKEYLDVRLKHVPQCPPSAVICGIMLADPEMLIEIQATAVMPEKS